MFSELDTMAKLHKVAAMDPTVLDAASAMRIATVGGATALGLQNLIGTLEPGKCADVIVVDMKKPHLTPLYHVFSHLAYACRGSDVRDSVINGRVVMRNRRLLTLNLPAVLADVCEIAARVRANP
jgi:5-methylthioadenosine/S-adenosylhomocysteine deaminase